MNLRKDHYSASGSPAAASPLIGVGVSDRGPAPGPTLVYIPCCLGGPAVSSAAGGDLFPLWPAPADGKTKTTLITVSSLREILNESKLSTMDLLVPASMKNAAKCDK